MCIEENSLSEHKLRVFEDGAGLFVERAAAVLAQIAPNIR
jgi:hypothetical protein